LNQGKSPDQILYERSALPLSYARELPHQYTRSELARMLMAAEIAMKAFIKNLHIQ
jgi:hypothetical protein